MDTVIKIRNLEYEISGNKILKGINIDIKRNKLIGLIGPNGSGKSTLLKCMNGINESKEAIMINDQYIEKYSDIGLAKSVAFMNQNTNVTFPFFCEEVVMMGRYPHYEHGRKKKEEDLMIVEEAISYTKTDGLSKKLITQVSGGEKQRVMLAKVLAQRAEVMLLDEPTASLDIRHEEEIFRMSKNLTSKDTTIVVAVHDLRVAIKYCDELILLKEGNVLDMGTVEEVLTSKNLSYMYDLDIEVYENMHTKLLDYYTK